MTDHRSQQSTGYRRSLVGLVLEKRYRVTEEIGRGGMGVVYGAVDIKTDEALAVKALQTDTPDGRDLAARFQREAYLQSMLDHPHVVTVRSMGALKDGTLYLVMDRVTGVRVDELIERRAMGPRKALIVTRQVLLALSYAHQHGVVHRDLKPENIMLVRMGEPGRQYDHIKLIDFGLAKLLDDIAESMGFQKLTAAGVVFGTPAYIAPEQALGRPLDGRTDLYALGVTLFEMLTGVLPFSAAKSVDVMRMHVQKPAPNLSSVASGAPWATVEMEYLVARALAKRPEDRFDNARQMTTAVDQAFASIGHLPPEE